MLNEKKKNFQNECPLKIKDNKCTVNTIMMIDDGR